MERAGLNFPCPSTLPARQSRVGEDTSMRRRANGPVTRRRVWRHYERRPGWTIQALHTFAVGQTQVLTHNSAGMASFPPNSGKPFPGNAMPGQILGNIDPNTLQAGRGDLEAGRLAQQQQLI